MATRRKRGGIAALAVVCAVVATASPAASDATEARATLTIIVTGLQSTEGDLRYWVYDRAEGFAESDGERIEGELPVSALDMRVVVPGLPYGEYAVAVGHDRNGDGRIAKVFGAEPRGVSNYGSPLRWYPSFDAAKFPVRAPQVEVVVSMF